MLRLTSKKTYQALEYILSNPNFTQTEVKDNVKISIGRVNKIVKWLVEKGFVIKNKAKYSIIKPNLLIETISMQVTLKSKMFFGIAISKVDAIKILKKKGAVLCLSSALENYDKDISENEVNVYFDDKLLDTLNEFERGELKINLFETNLSFDTKDNKTSKIRTIIDFNSTGNQNITTKLSKQTFGTLQ